jgi:hypothetical protein
MGLSAGPGTLDSGDLTTIAWTAAAFVVVFTVAVAATILVLKHQRKPFAAMVRSHDAHFREFTAARLADRVVVLEDQLRVSGDRLAAEQKAREALVAAVAAAFDAAGKTMPDDLMTTQPLLRAVRGG